MASISSPSLVLTWLADNHNVVELRQLRNYLFVMHVVVTFCCSDSFGIVFEFYLRLRGLTTENSAPPRENNIMKTSVAEVRRIPEGYVNYVTNLL